MNQQIFGSSTPDGMAPLNNLGVLILVSVFCSISILWGVINGIFLLRKQQVQEEGQFIHARGSDGQKLSNVGQMTQKIAKGIFQFLKYNFVIAFVMVIAYFLIIMGAIQKFQSFYTSAAYFVGAINALFCAMLTALVTGVSHKKVCNAARESVSEAYRTVKYAATFQSFFCLGWTVLLLAVFMVIYQMNKGSSHTEKDIAQISQALIAFSFGSATISVCTRILSSLYSKGSDQAINLMRRIDNRLPKNNSNPLIICKCIGQALNKCISPTIDFITLLAAVITIGTASAGTNVIGTDQQGQIIFKIALNNIYLPVIAISFCLFFCVLFNILTNYIFTIDRSQSIRFSLLLQKLIIFAFLLGFLSLAAYLCLPAEFQIKSLKQQLKHPYHAYICMVLGMFSALIILGFSQIINNSPFFVDGGWKSCQTGSATSLIFGLSFGYMFNPIPIILLATTCFLSVYWLGIFGLALSALGFLCLFPIFLMINNIYGISQSSSIISYICRLNDQTINNLLSLTQTRKNYEPQLQSLINCLFCFLGYSLVLMFIINSQMVQSIDLTQPAIFTGILIGAMIPYVFSSFIIRCVRNAPQVLCYDLKGQIDDMPGLVQGTVQPDVLRSTLLYGFHTVLQIKYFAPLLLFPLIIIGIALGPQSTVGFIIGITISGIQLSISFGMSGLIWTVTRNSIHYGNAKDDQMNPIKPDSDIGKASQVGAEVGYPFKDALSVSIPSFIFYMGIVCCVLSKLFVSIHE